MKSESSFKSSHDGLALHRQSWTAASAKADMAFVHGFFEHCDRYGAEAKFFNEAGYNFHAYDQRTHGKSGGKTRSFISDFDHYIKDYQQFLALLRLGEERPYFLCSHSMGGLVTCSYLLKHKPQLENCKGVIFSAPFLMPDGNTAPLLQKLSGVVGTLFPKAKVLKIDANAISRDAEEVKKYVNDPLIYNDKLYAASGYQLIKQMRSIRGKFSEITLPFLILHGTDDKLAEISGSELLYAESKSTDKTFIPLQDYKHEITRDLGKEKVLDTILEWMNNRI